MIEISTNTQLQIAKADAQRARMERERVTTLDEKTLRKIDKSAEDFENMFLAEMLRPLFAEINKPDEIFGGGKGEEIFGNMLVDEYAKKISDRGGIGLAKHVRDEMIRLQEESNGAR
jgi:flagellar protein FlgJ